MLCLINFCFRHYKNIGSAVQLLLLYHILTAAPYSVRPSFLLAAALQFEYPSFDPQQVDVGNLTLLSLHAADWYHSAANAYFSNSGLWLTAFNNNTLNGATQGDPSNIGRIVYKNPLQFVSNNNMPSSSSSATAGSPPAQPMFSFSTSFTFQIITTRPFPNCGSGMAFFIAESLQSPSKSDDLGALGLVDPFNLQTLQSFFAVEFDTHESPNFQDPSSSHIGIDIDSLISLIVTDTSPTSSSSFYPQLFLYNNSTFTVWIEYNIASNHLIQVWMAPNQSIASNATGAPGRTLSVNRPLHPCLQFQYDLSAVFSQKSMYIGFSAVSSPIYMGMEGHVIYSWNFRSDSVIQPHESGIKLYLVVAPAATTVGLALIVIGVVWMCVMRKRKQIRKKHAKGAPGRIENALQTTRHYSYRELRRATNDFDEENKVGEGGFGTVYKGVLEDGSVVAVKKLAGRSLMLEAKFCAEASIIQRVRHRYLLELQGWCYEDGQRAEAFLVSEYMIKGSLDGYLFDERKKEMLGRTALEQKETRMRVLAQVAVGLEYLHGGLGECVLHRDVKAANVLLTNDEEVEARLCDFGLARLIRHEEMGTMAMEVAGTLGYAAPEVLYDGLATDKADVFGFGVLALEVACGRRATSCNDQHISQWLWSFLPTNPDALYLSDEHICHVLDPLLLPYHNGDDHINADTYDIHAMNTQFLHDWRCVLHLGLLCCHPRPECRPNMKDVTRAFDTKLIFPLPVTKASSPYGYSLHANAYNIRSDNALQRAMLTTSSLSPSVLSAPR